MTNEALRRVWLGPRVAVDTNVTVPPGLRYGGEGVDLGGKSSPEPIVIRFIETDEIEPPSEEGALSLYGFTGSGAEDRVYVERATPFGGRARAEIGGVRKGVPTVRFSADYRRWTDVRGATLDAPDRLLASLLDAALIARGELPVHAALVARDGRASVILAPPDTGKSRTAGLLSGSGYEYMAEDCGAVGPLGASGFPFTRTLDKRHGSVSLGERTLGMLLKSRGPGSDKQAYHERFGTSNVRWEPAPLRDVYMLKRGDAARVTPVSDRQGFADELLALNRLELQYFRDRFLLTYCAASGWHVDDLMRQERDMFHEMVAAADGCFILEGPSDSFAPSIARIHREAAHPRT